MAARRSSDERRGEGRSAGFWLGERPSRWKSRGLRISNADHELGRPELADCSKRRAFRQPDPPRLAGFDGQRVLGLGHLFPSNFLHAESMRFSWRINKTIFL